MANKHVGEFEIKANGESYTMKFGTYALMTLEEKLNRSFPDILDDMNDPKKFTIKTAITMVWAALQDHHEGITMRQVADIVDDNGITETAQHIEQALIAALPELADGGQDEGKNPTNKNRHTRRAEKAKTKSTGKG